MDKGRLREVKVDVPKLFPLALSDGSQEQVFRQKIAARERHFESEYIVLMRRLEEEPVDLVTDFGWEAEKEKGSHDDGRWALILCRVVWTSTAC